MRDSANAIGSPPRVVLASIAIGVLLHFLVPVNLLSGFPAWSEGLPVVVAALVLFRLPVREFQRHETPVRGSESVTTTLIDLTAIRYTCRWFFYSLVSRFR